MEERETGNQVLRRAVIRVWIRQVGISVGGSRSSCWMLWRYRREIDSNGPAGAEMGSKIVCWFRRMRRVCLLSSLRFKFDTHPYRCCFRFVHSSGARLFGGFEIFFFANHHHSLAFSFLVDVKQRNGSGSDKMDAFFL